MNNISDDAISNFNKSRKLLKSLIDHSEEVERVFFSGSIHNFKMGSRCIELSDRQEKQLEEALGDELSVSYLYYSSISGEASIEAKAYCSELIRFGMGVLKGPFPFRMKIALLNYTHIMGYLFDRSNENYYVCENILRAFLDEVEQFYLAQDAENQEIIIKALFWGKADRLSDIKSYLDEVSGTVKANSNEQLEFVRNENVDKHIKLT